MTGNVAHYKGRVTWDSNRIFGPDTCGAYYRMDHIDYNPDADRSTVYFKPYLGVEVGR